MRSQTWTPPVRQQWKYCFKVRKCLQLDWQLLKNILIAVLLASVLLACSSNTVVPQQVKRTPVATTPTATVVTVPSGTLLYKADWSHGSGGWQTAPNWKIEQGQLATESDSAVTVPIPYTHITPNYAIELRAQIVRLLHRDGGYISISTQPTATKDGYQAGLSDLKGTEPRPNGSHPQVQAFLEPQSSTLQGTGRPIDYEPHFDWHTYRVEVKDNEVSLFIDGTAVSSADSTRTNMLSNGPITLGSAMIEVHISSLSITAL